MINKGMWGSGSSLQTGKTWLGSVLLILCVGLFALPGYGAVWGWSGGGGANANWNDSANWGFAGIPGNGDTVIFPASQPDLVNTNNIVGLVLNQIRFAGAGGGYDIRGNPFTLTNSILATNTAGVNVIEPAITLSTGTLTIVVSNGTSLTLDGNLSGPVGVTKAGTGTLTYQGPTDNTYTGTTLVLAGNLELNVGGYDAYEGPLVISDGSGNFYPVVQDLQGGELPSHVPITINSGGTLDLNGHNETYGTNLTMNGAIIDTETGTLTLLPNTTITVYSNTTCNINGNLNIGSSGTLAIQGMPDGDEGLFLDATLTGTASITQTNIGTVLYGANTFSGNYTANGVGELEILNSQALGNPTNSLTLNGQTFVYLFTGANLTNQSVTLNNTNGEYEIYVLGDTTNASWQANFINNDGLAIDVNFGCSLNLDGTISGAGAVTKLDAGTLTLSGANPNTYTGPTTVNAGTLLLGKSSGLAIPSPLVMNSNTTVRLLNNFQIGSVSIPVSMGDSSLLDMNTFTEEVGPITMQGAQISANGFLYLGGNITVNPSVVAFSLITGTCSLYGSLITITNTGHNFSPDLLFNANIDSGGATNGLIKAGAGEVSLGGDNTFTGPVTVNAGALWVQSAAALGNTTAPATVNSGGSMYLDGAGMDFGLKPLILNGNGYYFGALSSQGSSSWEGPVTLSSDCTIYQSAGISLTLSGTISGPGGLTKTGPGICTLAGSGNNLYEDPTYVTGGTLNLDKVGFAIGFSSLTIGNGTGSAASTVVREFSNYQIDEADVVINSDGLLDLNGYNDTIGPAVTLNGGASILNTSAGALNFEDGTTLAVNSGNSIISGNLNVGDLNTTCLVTNYNADLNLNASVAGAANITFTGNGATYLNAANSYGGLTWLQQGYLYAANNLALGATNNGTVVNSGATLVLSGSIGITNESLTLNGPGTTPSWGSLDVETGTNIWAGPILLNGNSRFDAWDAGSALHLSGPITGPGGAEFFGYSFGGGTHYLEGTSTNTYAGATTVDVGSTLELNKTSGNFAIPGSNLQVAGTVQLLSDNQLGWGTEVNIPSTGQLLLNNHECYMDGLSGTGKLDLSTVWAAIGWSLGTSTFGGTITGAGNLYNRGFITLTGTNTYTGTTFVYQNELSIDGSQPQSPVSINAGTLGGSGTVGPILDNDTIAPGSNNVPGILSCGNVTFNSVGKFKVLLTGPTPGIGYDQLNITGTNTLANATLTVVPAFTTPVSLGQQFIIMNNDGSDTNIGTFNSLPEGSQISVGGYSFNISYVGGSGNDVVLSLTSLPAASAAATVTAGDGSHNINPNGCNDLGLAITNTAGTAMTGVSATLSTITEGVVISQPYATYPNIPANGSATNIAPFQISIPPSFPCGAQIDLQLIVNSSAGSFILNYVLNTGESAAPTRFDNNTVTNVPDVGTIISTNLLTNWLGGPITKVTVSLWLGAPVDSDMTLTLISPTGITVPLATGVGGANPNFGTGTADASRTVFDDDATNSIASGTAPLVGTFRPQSPLSALIGSYPVGAWQLKIQDSGFYGSPDTLRAWSLFLSGTSCSTGSGACDYCLTSISGEVTNTDPVQIDRVYRQNGPSTCGAPKVWPGYWGDGLPRHYNIYAFTNTTPADACVSALLVSSNDLQEAIYLNSFIPTDISSNYLGDPGVSTSSNIDFPVNCSASIPPGATFYVVVNEVTTNAGGYYALQMSGLPCPPPTLNIQTVAPHQTRVYWNTSEGGYLLEANSNLVQNTWGTTTNQPIVNGGTYNVTNSGVLPTVQFYRLYKP